MPRRERPLDESDDPLVRFAADLRRLREKAGGIGYRELGRKAHYSAAALSEAASGRKLPTLAVTLAYVRACDGDPDEWEERWRSLVVETPVAEDRGLAPYQGLAPFQPQDADRFFGRDRLVEDLTSRLAKQSFLAVFGASGAGKSSLLRAGLLPALDGTKILLTPGAHPMREMAVRIAATSGGSSARLLTDLEANPANLNLVLRQENVAIVVVDQFEEVFTVCADPAERDAFVAALLACENRVVIGVRTDFYTHCSRHAGLVEALRDAQVTVGPMTTDELRQAITKPATQAGLNVESALLAHLVAEAHGRAGVLPLLSHALLETWKRRRGTTLTLTGFQAAGGIDGALARTADAIHSSLTAEEQQDVRGLFLRLTAPGEGTEDTKRRIDRAELDEQVPQALVEARLITVDGDNVEITHESLIRSWPRLRDWLAEDRAALRAHRQLTDATTEWETHDRDPGALYRGARLAVAKELDRDALSKREQAFLDASVDAENEQLRVAKRQTRRTRAFAAALAVLLLIASGVAVYATREQRVSNSRALAAQALQLHDSDPANALRLALDAYRAHPTTEARSALIYTAGRPANTGSIPANGTGAMALSPNGQLLAVGEVDHVDLWDVRTRTKGDPLPLPRPENVNWSSPEALAFSPDSGLLVIGNATGVHLYDVASGRFRLLVPPATGQFSIRRLATDGVRVVAAVGDLGGEMPPNRVSRVIEWELAGGDPRQIGEAKDADVAVHPGGPAFLVSPDGGLSSSVNGVTTRAPEQRGGDVLAVSPDGAAVATGDSRGIVSLWDGRTLAHTGELIAGGPVTGVTHAGGLLVVCTQNEIQLWDPARGVKLHQERIGYTVGRTQPAATSDGTIAAYGDGRVTLWQLDRMPYLLGPDDLKALTFTPDGLAAASWGDQADTVVAWPRDRPAPPRPAAVGPNADVHLDAFTPDGTGMTVTTGYTTTIKDVRTGAVTATLVPDEKYMPKLSQGSPLSANEFSRDGSLLATSTPGFGLVWDVRERKVRNTFESPGILVFAPGNTRFALYGPNGDVRLQDVGSDQPGEPWQTGIEVAGHLTFGADGVLIVARGDGSVHFLDVDDRTELGRVQAHAGRMSAMALSPDGALLATAGADRKLNIWDTRTRTLWASLPVPTGANSRIAWDPTGTELAVSDDDGVTVWPVNPNVAVHHACVLLRQAFSNLGAPPETC